MTLPALPPTTAPRIWPAIAPTWNFCPWSPARCLPQRHVGDLVRHDARHLAFGLRRFDHAAVKEHRPARQRKRVDLLLIDDLEGVAELRVLELARNRPTSSRPTRST